jgi:hypothetical protein
MYPPRSLTTIRCWYQDARSARPPRADENPGPILGPSQVLVAVRAQNSWLVTLGILTLLISGLPSLVGPTCEVERLVNPVGRTAYRDVLLVTVVCPRPPMRRPLRVDEYVVA